MRAANASVGRAVAGFAADVPVVRAARAVLVTLDRIRQRQKGLLMRWIPITSEIA